jgi:parvulin-like peptidyl-prolyl isomerase
LKNYPPIAQLQMSSPSLHNLILDRAIATVEYTKTEHDRFHRQLASDQTYQIWLRQQGVTLEQFEAWVSRELRIRKFQHQRWGKRLTSYFLDRKRQLDQVVCSLIYLRDKDMARELYFRIIEGEQSFAEVARVYSQRSDIQADIQADGKLGPIALGKLEPDLAQMFYGSRAGQLWKPTVMAGWVVIAQLEQQLPVQLDESMRQYLLNELLERWLQDQVERQFPAL